MDEQQMQSVGNQMNNLGYQGANALQIRLETENQLNKIKSFLSGCISQPLQDEKTGKIIMQKIKVSDRLMNDEGVNHLVNYISSIINPQVVQGNYGLEWYQEQLYNTHRRLAFILTTNRPKWKIEPSARYSIIGFLMEFIKPYLSRLIENKERESYSNTIRTMESSTMQTQNNGLFGGKIGIN